MHQHMARTDQLESNFAEKDLQVLEGEFSMSQKLASFSSFLPFFLGCLSLFSVLCVFFFNYYYLVLIVLIFLPHGKYAGFIQAASAFRKAVILSHPLLSSSREDFQA